MWDIKNVEHPGTQKGIPEEQNEWAQNKQYGKQYYRFVQVHEQIQEWLPTWNLVKDEKGCHTCRFLQYLDYMKDLLVSYWMYMGFNNIGWSEICTAVALVHELSSFEVKLLLKSWKHMINKLTDFIWNKGELSQHWKESIIIHIN